MSSIPRLNFRRATVGTCPRRHSNSTPLHLHSRPPSTRYSMTSTLACRTRRTTTCLGTPLTFYPSDTRSLKPPRTPFPSRYLLYRCSRFPRILSMRLPATPISPLLLCSSSRPPRPGLASTAPPPPRTSLQPRAGCTRCVSRKSTPSTRFSLAHTN